MIMFHDKTHFVSAIGMENQGNPVHHNNDYV